MTEKSDFNGILFDLNDSVQNVTDEEISKEAEILPETKTGEVEIGDAPYEAKCLDVLTSKEVDEAEIIVKELEKLHETPFSHDKEKCSALKKKLHEKKKLIDLYQSIKWMSVRASIENCPDSVGIRKGWKVVSVPEEETSGGIGIISIGMGGNDLEFLKLMEKLNR
jgi:transcriptional regulator of heat shock response